MSSVSVTIHVLFTAERCEAHRTRDVPSVIPHDTFHLNTSWCSFSILKKHSGCAQEDSTFYLPHRHHQHLAPEAKCRQSRACWISFRRRLLCNSSSIEASHGFLTHNARLHCAGWMCDGVCLNHNFHAEYPRVRWTTVWVIVNSSPKKSWTVSLLGESERLANDANLQKEDPPGSVTNRSLLPARPHRTLDQEKYLYSQFGPCPAYRST